MTAFARRSDTSSHPDSPWWRGATLYHAYVRSFQDSDGDGFGDLGGLIDRLDYLEWLGIRGLWLSPTMPSPNHDWGYDVADYTNVQSDLGSLAVMDRLIEGAKARGIQVILDLVPNHTSSEHPWFLSAKSSRDSPYRNFYVWADGKEDEALPNNWIDDTGEVAWTWEPTTEQYYFHNFLPHQPDLNWWEPRVHEEFDRIMAFWYDRGIAGFRIDVANGLYHDRLLRDNPANPKAVIYDKDVQGRYGLEHRYNFNQPEVHEVYRAWRVAADERAEPRLLLGETWVARVEELAPYYGSGDELQLGFNFPLIFAEFTPLDFARIVRESFESFPAGADTVWAGSNHDLPRMGTRWAKGDTRKIRLAHTVLGLLPGTFVIYYGDELGMLDSDIPAELQKDPLTAGFLNGQWPRDNARAPMRWDDSAEGGFTDGAAWLPIHPDVEVNVAGERADPDSVLSLVRRLISLHSAELATAATYDEIEVSDDRWMFSTGRLVVAANFSDAPIPVSVTGDVVINSASRDVSRPSSIAPWSALVVAPDSVSEAPSVAW
ncbi:MAG: glycosidase [Frondihabitans sp.]|nr:glycosidase [Frondihabitans sp.]